MVQTLLAKQVGDDPSSVAVDEFYLYELSHVPYSYTGPMR
jgi:hypothetical protein